MKMWRMKLLFSTFVFFIAIQLSHAQTYDEWFRQGKTQKKYLLQQIAALQMYTGYAEKGYSIATKGLRAIKDIKNGDFNLHNNHFSSLFNVNPNIKKTAQVADIIATQFFITNQAKNIIKYCVKSGQLSPSEIKYLKQVFSNLLDDCAKNLDELFGLITNGELQINDDERLRRIDRLYCDMQDKQVFVQSFGNAAKGLSLQRLNDHFDIEIGNKLNGLK